MFLIFFHILIYSFIIKGEEQSWECGNDDFTKLLSESSVDGNCPELKWEINGCCLKHDDCYDKQLGRTYCDDTFCNCLSNVTISNKKCHEDDAESFCILVREFGEGAYNASAPHLHTEVPKIIQTTLKPKNVTIKGKNYESGSIKSRSERMASGYV
uniref:Phospholipase A(2) n=1 Tax=Parastrongyloides trichosuri TaxID=131310 RepID=A0A0N4ZXD5_PARTI